MGELQQIIENAWDNRDLLKNEEVQRSIRKVIDLLNNALRDNDVAV